MMTRKMMGISASRNEGGLIEFSFFISFDILGIHPFLTETIENQRVFYEVEDLIKHPVKDLINRVA